MVTASASESSDLFALKDTLQEQVRAARPDARIVYGAGEGLGASFNFSQLAASDCQLRFGTDIGFTADKVDCNLKPAIEAGCLPQA